MTAAAFILNIPWTTIGLIMALLSVPTSVRLHRQPFVIVFSVRSFWYRTRCPKAKGIRGCVQGQVMLLGPNLLPHDFEHELVHIEQMNRAPFIHPFLYAVGSIRHGYRRNHYEVEAYRRAGNPYLEK